MTASNDMQMSRNSFLKIVWKKVPSLHCEDELMVINITFKTKDHKWSIMEPAEEPFCDFPSSLGPQGAAAHLVCVCYVISVSGPNALRAWRQPAQHRKCVLSGRKCSLGRCEWQQVSFSHLSSVMGMSLAF